MPLIPSLIFGEFHDDSITDRVMHALTPHLKNLGYDTFIDEYSPKEISEKIDYWHNSSNEQFNLNQNLLIPWLMKNDMNIKGGDHYYARKLILTIMDSNPDTFWLRVLQMYSLKLVDTTFGMYLRDQSLCQAYHYNETPFFARVGLAHFEGIQNILTKMLTFDTTQRSFLFFHIYTKDHIDFFDDYINYGELSEKAPLEEARYHESFYTDYLPSLPIKVNIINAKKKPVEKIVNEILKQIQKHSAQNLNERSLPGEQENGKQAFFSLNQTKSYTKDNTNHIDLEYDEIQLWSNLSL
ncbi:hypothetical protein [Legionella sp. W05-934-2]|uniref:hypothetical protein n=1 Tax=Legionella sp. W05-934-2 TaxID=1198649 RepID=UPI003462F41D